MCKLCPKCGSCGGGPGASGPGGAGSCDARGPGAACDTYCTNPALTKGVDNHTLRHEPCFPHQSYKPGYPANAIPDHDTPDRYIGDFNNANQTNLYTVRGAYAFACLQRRWQSPTLRDACGVVPVLN
jgi:hypothetical protein